MTVGADLAEAIRQGDLAKVEEMIQNWSDIKINKTLPRTGKKSALFVAAELGQTAIVELLLNAGAEIGVVDGHGQTATHAAARHDDVETLTLLQQRGADLGVQDPLGRTPLDFAVANLCPHTIVLLLNADAAFSQFSRGGPRYHDDWMRAATVSPAVTQAMLKHRAFDSIIHNLLFTSPFEHDIFCVLVVSDVILDARTYMGHTPLYHAVYEGNVSDAFALLAAGADANVRPHKRSPNERETVLHLAVLSRNRARSMDDNLSLIHALIACGADLDAENPFFTTPRKWMAKNDVVINPDGVESARQQIAKLRLELVRERALAVCVGLHSLRIDALQMCEILQCSCGAIGSLIPFHQWWKIATTVKHFLHRQRVE